jgi:hypothetical protein
MSVAATTAGWDITLANSFSTPPGKIVVHIPWFYQARQATVDGKTAKIANGRIDVPASARRIRVTGAMKPDIPELSFDRTVANYKADYRKRYEEFLRTGVTKP